MKIEQKKKKKEGKTIPALRSEPEELASAVLNFSTSLNIET